ncbi:hypothetical protein BYT27DRAFT_7220484 [Phlegmacium glaucopus]|nr:hypothetical protein BYT27DRAFT_7220484 [Phlegmacium glaucopus]
MSSEIVTPFHGDKEDKNPEDFLRAFFRRMGNNGDEVKKSQFPNYLQADGVADDWFLDLNDNEKKTWAEIETAFRKRWPRKKQVKKTVEEYEEEILNQKLMTEELAKKEKVAGRELYSHVVWADKMAKAVKGAKLDKTTTYIRQVRRELPSIFMEIWNKNQAEQRAIKRRIQILETVSKSPTAPIRQQLSAVAISKRQTSSNTANINNPFEGNSGGQGNLRFTTNPNGQRQTRATTANFGPRSPPTAEQKAELHMLLSTIPHHPDTQAGRQAHQAQQAEWMRTYGPGTKVTEKTPYPLRPGTAPVNSGECFTCGQVGHLGSRSGENCQALGHRMLHPNEQQWRVICARILKEPRNATNIHFLAVDDYGTNWQDIQGNEEGLSK